MSRCMVVGRSNLRHVEWLERPATVIGNGNKKVQVSMRIDGFASTIFSPASSSPVHLR